MTADERELFEKFPYLHQDEYFDIHGYKKQPEIFPGTEILAINNRHRAEDLWWTIEDKDARGVWRKAINAKAENVLWAEMFKDAFLKDRVLIPATGLFEWHQLPDRTKKKYEIWFDEPVFAFGGIARECTIRDEQKRCGVILTTRPNSVFEKIHNTKQRQAVIIHSYDHETWLDPETPVSELRRLMEPVAAEETHFKEAEASDPAQASLFDVEDCI